MIHYWPMINSDERVWADPKIAAYFEGVRQNSQRSPVREDGRQFLQFDYEQAAVYAAKGVPYIAHSRSGGLVNMTTGQVVME